MEDTESDSEEEVLIYVDFKDLIKPETIKNNNFEVFKAIGLDSDKPILQLNNHFFDAEYGDCMGTELFFKEDPDPPEMDPIFDNPPKKFFQYLCKTRKVLNLKRVFLQDKDEGIKEKPESSDLQLQPAASVEEALEKVEHYFHNVGILENLGNTDSSKRK